MRDQYETNRPAKAHATDFFRPIKRKGDLIPLEEDIRALGYDSYEEGLDKKNFPCFRLFKAGKKVGIVVVLNELALAEVKAILGRGKA